LAPPSPPPVAILVAIVDLMQILIVDDQPEVLMFLQEVLTDQGYEVLTASDGPSGLEAYQQHRPAFTLTDISMPGMSGLDLLKQIKELNPEAAVMLMTGAGSEAYAVEALRLGAVNYFNKPVDINELGNTLNRYAALAAGFDYERYAAQFMVAEHLALCLDNDIDFVNHAVQMIINHCRSIFPLTEIFTLRFGLYEMLVNAIEHGNLGITYQEKSAALEQNRLGELLKERAAEPERAARRVHITCDIKPEGLTCRIRDEGDGFDHSMYSNTTDPAQLFEELGTSLHGRGILLTSLQFDTVRFNDKGNEVFIFKRSPNFPAPPPGTVARQAAPAELPSELELDP